LLTGALFVVATLVAAIVLIAGGRLRDRLVFEKTGELLRGARMVAADWHAVTESDSLARYAGEALGYRITLVDDAGVVIGDSEFGPEARLRLENDPKSLPRVRMASDHRSAPARLPAMRNCTSQCVIG
jgi:hypothetical protein